MGYGTGLPQRRSRKAAGLRHRTGQQRLVLPAAWDKTQKSP